jgi:hypothetical protein
MRGVRGFGVLRPACACLSGTNSIVQKPRICPNRSFLCCRNMSIQESCVGNPQYYSGLSLRSGQGSVSEIKWQCRAAAVGKKNLEPATTMTTTMTKSRKRTHQNRRRTRTGLFSWCEFYVLWHFSFSNRTRKRRKIAMQKINKDEVFFLFCWEFYSLRHFSDSITGGE